MALTYRKKKTQKIVDTPQLRTIGGRAYYEKDYGWGSTLQDTGMVGGSRTAYEKAATSLLRAQEAEGKAATLSPASKLKAEKQRADMASEVQRLALDKSRLGMESDAAAMAAQREYEQYQMEKPMLKALFTSKLAADKIAQQAAIKQLGIGQKPNEQTKVPALEPLAPIPEYTPLREGEMLSSHGKSRRKKGTITDEEALRPYEWLGSLMPYIDM